MRSCSVFLKSLKRLSHRWMDANTQFSNWNGRVMMSVPTVRDRHLFSRLCAEPSPRDQPFADSSALYVVRRQPHLFVVGHVHGITDDICCLQKWFEFRHIATSRRDVLFLKKKMGLETRAMWPYKQVEPVLPVQQGNIRCASI